VKVLHIIDSQGIYGAEMVLLNLMREQEQMGLNPILGSIGDLIDPEIPLEIEALRRGLKVARFRMTRGYNLSGSLRIVRFAINQKIDLFHSHGYKGNILLGSLPRRLRKIPIISTLHGWTSIKKISKIWLYDCLDKICLRRIDAVVRVTSVNSGTWNSRILKGLKTFVVENGIPLLPFDVESVIRKDPLTVEFCRNVFVIGSIGRLSEEKGITQLIQAMHLLSAKKEDYKAVIIGEGPQRGKLENMMKRTGLSHRVMLTGYREKAFQYLPLFDVFVLPSITEGLPITILEAMQAGIPIVASPVGGVSQVLRNGQYGTLVEPGNPDALAGAISYLRQNPDTAREMAQRAKEFALVRYSSRRMAEDYHEVYEHVLRNWRAK